MLGSFELSELSNEFGLVLLQHTPDLSNCTQPSAVELVLSRFSGVIAALSGFRVDDGDGDDEDEDEVERELREGRKHPTASCFSSCLGLGAAMMML